MNGILTLVRTRGVGGGEGRGAVVATPSEIFVIFS